MRVMWSGNVDYINIGVGEHFVIVIVNLADIVFLDKIQSLAVRSVSDSKEISSVFRHGIGGFVCDYARTETAQL